jgi:hypothetical protein
MSTVPNLGCRKLEEKAKQNVLLEMNGWQVRPCIQIRLRSCLFLVFHYFLLVFSRSKLDDFTSEKRKASCYELHNFLFLRHPAFRSSKN